jgi:DNA-binding response OmpR family regulator
MTRTEGQITHRVLLVDDDDSVRAMMSETLEHKGFEVVAAANVTDALTRIATERFDVLITDLHMPDPGDGFTVVSAMRHSQPNALTMLVSGYPDVQRAMAAILLEADEIVVKPFEIGRFTDLIQERILNRKSVTRSVKERVSSILERCSPSIVSDWLQRVNEARELSHIPLSDTERTGHLPKVVADLVVRLRKPSTTPKDSDAISSDAAVAHGKLRYQQGYTPAMLVHESRILQVAIFGTLKDNLNSLDFSLLLPDIMTIADEVDAQLTQSMESFMKLGKPVAA